MNQRWLRRILILLAAAALCLVLSRVTYGGRQDSTGRLTLWYTGSDIPRPLMDALVSRCRVETGLRIEAAAFPDERAMGEAFEGERPDLVFCGLNRAAGFERRESLGEAESSVAVPEALREVWDEVGSSFFPIGGRLPLLLVNTALCGERFDHLEALLSAAGNRPFLASDDWSELLYTAVTVQGGQMSGDPGADGRSRIYRELYNSLAEAAFRGALLPAESAADYVREGLLPCAVVRSAALAGLTGKELDVRPLPLPEGARIGYPAELMGFALPEGADTERAALFLQWFYRTSAGKTALGAGLVPVTAAEGRTALEACLLELSRGDGLLWLSPGTAFCENREDCENRLSRALNLLT